MIEREHHGESQANGSCANPKSLTAPPRGFQTRCHNVTTSLVNWRLLILGSRACDILSAKYRLGLKSFLAQSDCS
jgi:hypothetical protein